MIVTRGFLSYGALLGVTAAVMSAGCMSPETQMREIDAQADPVLKQMCSTLGQAKAFRLRVNATMDRPVNTGQMAQFHRTSELTFFRPDRLYAETSSDDGHWVAWYRGKTLTILDKDSNVYATETVPDRIDKMLDYLVDEYDLVMPMADLLVGETYNSLLADAESGAYLGLHNVGDTPCHHLLYRQENLDWQIWIDSGKLPLPRKFMITYTQEPDQPQYIATIDGWDLTPQISADAFTFTAPANAERSTMAELVADK